MICVLCLLFLVKSTSVLCGLLLPKDASYGFVPRDSKVVQLSKNEDLWAPYAASDNRPIVDSDAVVINAPNAFRSSNDSSSVFSDNFQSNNNVSQSRSPKFSQYPSTLYYYEPPPPPQYLPPPLDQYPEYPTSRPTDEEFINRPNNDIPQDAPSNGYHYDTPDAPLDGLLPPFGQDEPIPLPPAPQYLSVVPPPLNGLYDAPYYGTKGASPNSLGDTDEGFPRQRNPLNIKVTDMHCYDTPNDGRFQTTITVRTQNENVPVFEDILPTDASSCVVKSDVIQPRVNTRFKINIPKSKFKECAVRDCSVSKDVVHLCVRLRFPTIARMKLADDTVLTLQCRTQDRIAAHTKHLAVNIDNSISARSSEIAKGGTRGGLRSHVTLFRRGSRGDHSEPLPRGARVPLGEMLMLKALIEAQDGWLASRMSTVLLTGANGATMTLLGADGCRDHRARALCPRDARSIGPLGHTLYIRAAMFEGMKSGEEVRLSVRMVACLDPADCRSPRCIQGGPGRNKRDAKFKYRETEDKEMFSNIEAANQTIDSTSIISFKVVLPDEFENSNDDIVKHQPMNQTPLIIMLIVLSATIVCSSILIFVKKQYY